MIQMQRTINTLKEGKEEFIVDCKIRNLSVATIKYYNESFDYFIEYIEKTYKNLNIKRDITKQAVTNFIKGNKVINEITRTTI